MIKNATYLTSAKLTEQIIDDEIPEYSFAGRSNVGKSSLINMLTNNSKLCRVSKEPGRTRMVNYFLCNNGDFRIVDLPGYGYARVSDEEKNIWANLIEEYFKRAKRLKIVFFLLDIRVDPNENDMAMLNWLYYYAKPFKIILTKADKLGKSEKWARTEAIASALALTVNDIIVSSSLKREGKEAILDHIK